MPSPARADESDARGPLSSFDRLLRRIRMREDSHNKETMYFPGGYERDLNLTLAETAEHSVQRTVICASEAAAVESYSDAIWREVAESGVACRQVLVLSHLGLLNEGVRSRAQADADSGIDVRVISATALSDALAAATAERILVDESVLAIAPTAGQTTSSMWTITTNATQLAEGTSVFDELWGAADSLSGLPQDLSLEEPLVQSAALISRVAPVLCAGDHVDQTDCSWYHGSWQFLRLMDVVSTPTWHHEFYSESIQQALRAGARSICVTGTADYSVLAYIFDAIEHVGSEAKVTVVDLCHTPLFAAQWYAKRAKVQVTTVAQDILAFAAERSHPFDLIVTDAFLTRFPGDEVHTVLGAWSDLLSADGGVITTVRAHPETQKVQSQEDAVAGFRERATVRWKRWEAFVPVHQTEVARRAENYARRMVSNPIGSEEDIETVLSQHFRIVSSELADVPGELFPTRYLRTVLRKVE